MQKKILLFMLCYLLIFTNKTTICAMETIGFYEVNTSENVSDVFFKNQELAEIEAAKFVNYCLLQQKMSGEEPKGYTVDGIGKDNLPYYYGGRYINKYGNLVIEIVDEYYSDVIYESDIYCEIEKIFDFKTENIIFKRVDNSYVALILLMEDILNYAKHNEWDGIIGVGIDDAKNEVVIELKKDIRSELLSGLKDVISNRACEITYGESDIEFTEGAYHGEGVETYDEDGEWLNSFSIAFYAEKIVGGEHIEGFVTAGHCLDDNQIALVYSKNNEFLGTYYPGNRSLGGNADAAFFILNHGVTPFLTVYNDSTFIYNENRVVSQGGIVNKRGEATGVTTGVVYQTSSSWGGIFNNEYIELNDMIRASYNSDHGDSGGIVYTRPSGNSAYIVGVHSGRNNTLNNPYSVYTKAGNILVALDVQFRE